MGNQDAPGAEHVVLLDEDGRSRGSAAKAEVHHADTPLHLAFSCYVFDAAGRLLVTRRSRGKRTFPGVWTNSFCGHPGPGEPLDSAARRRARQELGLELGPMRLVLPRFRYRAEQDGVVENEMCPVFVARADTADPDPDPTEIEDVRRVPWRTFSAEVLAGTYVGVSPWCADQVPALARLGPDPESWPTGDPAQLPPAACLEHVGALGRAH